MTLNHTPEMPEWQPPQTQLGETFYEAVHRQFFEEGMHHEPLAELVEIAPAIQSAEPIVEHRDAS